MKEKFKNLKKLKDVKFYLENFTKIKIKKQGQLVPFILKEMQKDLFNVLKKYSRVMLLKARQMGASTAIVGFFYHNTIMTPGTNTALIGYNTDLTAEFLEKVKTFYNSTPASLRPTIHYNTKYEISFPRMNSKIICLPSTQNVGRGYTLHNVLASELAFWEDAEEKMATIEASVPIGGKIVIESTPFNIGNLYHRMWMTDNDYFKKEYGWPWEYSCEEIEIIRKRMGAMKFAQHYGLEFLSSGMAVFEAELMRRMRKNIWKIGDLVQGADKSIHRVYAEEGWVIYHDPVPGEHYVAGADVSEGVYGGDYSVAHIFKRSNGEEVAMFRGLLPPDRFGNKLDKMGRRYNNALMAVEVNNHGLTTITVLKQKVYPSLFYRQAKFETLGMSFTDKIGWRTTKITRSLLIDEFAQVCRSGEMVIHSKETVDEMSVLVYDKTGDMNVPSGFYDDGIFAAAIAYQAFKIMYTGALTQLDYSKHLPKTFTY